MNATAIYQHLNINDATGFKLALNCEKQLRKCRNQIIKTLAIGIILTLLIVPPLMYLLSIPFSIPITTVVIGSCIAIFFLITFQLCAAHDDYHHPKGGFSGFGHAYYTRAAMESKITEWKNKRLILDSLKNIQPSDRKTMPEELGKLMANYCFDM